MTTAEQSVVIIELDLNYCANTYGESPCTAAGSSKCWNSRNILDDCQDVANFTPSTKTLYLSVASDAVKFVGVDTIPNVIKAEITSPRIWPGEDLGERLAADMVFRDHPHGDAGLDKYWGERNYIASDQGTFWGKIRARFPYLKGSALRIKQGFASWDYADFDVYNLVIDSFSGPDERGNFRISAVDIFSFLDDSKAQAPELSNGYLSAGIDDTQTTAVLAPTGIGDAEYPSSGLITIGKETVSFTRSGDNLTITRAQNNTEPDTHDAEDLCQLALEYSAQTVDLIAADLIERSELTSSNIPSSEWSSEITQYIDENYQAIITQPTGISSLLKELIVQAGLSIWPDALTNLIRMRALRPIAPTATLIDDDHIIDGTFRVMEQQDKRVSSVWTWYNQRNPNEKLDDETNYFSAVGQLGSQSDQYTNSAIKKIFSRWIPQNGQATVQALNSQILSRYESPPRLFYFDLPRTFAITMGQGARITSRYLQGCDGAQLPAVPCQIISVGPGLAARSIVAMEMNFVDQSGITGRLIIIDYLTYNLNLRELYDQIYSTLATDEDVTVIVAAGAIVGSINTSLDAFEILDEDWPSGVTITVIVDGRVSGAGGKGGRGDVGTDGEAGGTAFKITRAVTIDNTNGEIWGGGGGGGGTGQYSESGNTYSAGGGGGTGSQPGEGGTAPSYVGGLYVYDGNGEPGTDSTGGAPGNIPSMGGPLPAGAGGGPGQAGSASPDYSTGDPGAGGAAGNAVDGDSFVTWTATGDIQGGQIN